MATDALLTLVGLIVAIATLMSREQRLDFRVRTAWHDWAVGVSALLLVYVIKFTPAWEAQGRSTFGPWRWGFDADLASNAIILLAALYLAVRVILR